MGCVIDHLQSDHAIRVLQDFRDARGTFHRAGESGVVRRMDLDWLRQEIVISWEREGAIEAMYFSLSAVSGPRNGRMREYFELGERVAVPGDGPKQGRSSPVVAVPELERDPITDTSRYGDAVTRVWALAARHRFEEAEVQCQLITAAPDPIGGRLESLADDLVAMAVTHSGDSEEAVYEWARAKAVQLWYAWGSCATSGGEGAARMEKIRAAEDKLARCHASRG